MNKWLNTEFSVKQGEKNGAAVHSSEQTSSVLAVFTVARKYSAGGIRREGGAFLPFAACFLNYTTQGISIGGETRPAAYLICP